MLVGNALWQLIIQSDGMTKFVLLVLLCMSLGCWTLFLYRLILNRLQKTQFDTALQQIDQVRDMDHLLHVVTRFSGTAPGYFLSKQLTAIKDCLLKKKQEGVRTLNADDIVWIRENGFAVIDDVMYQEEGILSLLSTSAGLSPLLGLFGTVWGLIHAFVGISQQQSADISTVAPGIAEALITTLAGLMVAIPAMAMYNYLLSKTGLIEQRLMALAHATVTLARSIFT